MATENDQPPYGGSGSGNNGQGDWNPWLNQGQQGAGQQGAGQQPSQQPLYRDLYPQQGSQQASQQPSQQTPYGYQQSQSGLHSSPAQGRQAPPTWTTTQQPRAQYQQPTQQYAQATGGTGGGNRSGGKQKKPSKAAAFVSGFLGVALGLALGGGITYNVVSNRAAQTVKSNSPITFTDPTAGNSSGTSVTIQASGEDTTLAEAVALKGSQSVVSVYVYATTSQGYGYFSSQTTESETLYATGSGVIISADGYIITNEHVVADGERYTVLIGGEEVAATLVGTDPSSDIAVLKVDKAGLVPMDIGNSDEVDVGEWCMTLGSPYGLDQSASTGIVSAKFRSTAMQSTTGVAIYANLIQTDAAINSGSSGGALIDATGSLIGITTLTTSSGFSIGFAIPVNYAMSIAQQIIDTGEAHHAYLGVSMASLDSSLASQVGVDLDSGVYLSSVTSGLAADNAGLKEGDVIIGIDSTRITTAASLIMTVRTYNVGDTVTITYVRDGEQKTCQCTLSSDEGHEVAGTTTHSSSGDSGYGGGYGGGRGGR